MEKKTKKTAPAEKNVKPEVKPKIARTLSGVIVSDKMMSTRVVEVSRMKKHPKYQRYYKVSRTFAAHDANNEYKMGDKVTIQECRPLSKTKRWIITSKA